MNSQYYNPNGFKNIWFTSDLHYGHKNFVFGTSNWPCKTKCRQFQTVEDMNNHLINRINEFVMPQDVLIHLGDWSFGGKDNIPLARSRINCQSVVTLIGNHDEHFLKDESLHYNFTWVGHYNEFRKSKILICKFHYPMSVWHENNKGSFHLHGHSHHSFQNIGKSMDVGIDAPDRDYKPYHIDEVFDILSKKEIVALDHHH